MTVNIHWLLDTGTEKIGICGSSQIPLLGYIAWTNPFHYLWNYWLGHGSACNDWSHAIVYLQGSEKISKPKQ